MVRMLVWNQSTCTLVLQERLYKNGLKELQLIWCLSIIYCEKKSYRVLPFLITFHLLYTDRRCNAGHFKNWLKVNFLLSVKVFDILGLRVPEAGRPSLHGALVREKLLSVISFHPQTSPGTQQPVISLAALSRLFPHSLSSWTFGVWQIWRKNLQGNLGFRKLHSHYQHSNLP